MMYIERIVVGLPEEAIFKVVSLQEVQANQDGKAVREKSQQKGWNRVVGEFRLEAAAAATAAFMMCLALSSASVLQSQAYTRALWFPL